MKTWIAITLLIISACSGDEEVFGTLDLRKPVITGLVFKSDIPDQVIGILGKPSSQPEKNGYRMSLYPNPFINIANIYIAAPQNTQVKVYLVPANLGQPAASLVKNYAGANTLIADGRPLASFEITINTSQTIEWPT